MCPYCKVAGQSVKKGFYKRPSDGQRFQRYLCKACGKKYSDQNFAVDFRLRRRDITQVVFFNLCSGMSQRRCAAAVNTKPRTIARRLDRFGGYCRDNLEIYRKTREKASRVQFDEMESHEHTKCKPLTMPIAVEKGTRKILALSVGAIAAKGRLAEKSVAKYGKRDCERKKCLDIMLDDLKECVVEDVHIQTDMSQHYPSPIKKKFPKAQHTVTKGKRGSTTGYGELKKVGFDPIFTLNHNYAMIRDNMKRLSRRTWCTTKLKAKLELFLYLYAWFHNLWLERKTSPVKLTRLRKQSFGLV